MIDRKRRALAVSCIEFGPVHNTKLPDHEHGVGKEAPFGQAEATSLQIFIQHPCFLFKYEYCGMPATRPFVIEVRSHP